MQYFAYLKEHDSRNPSFRDISTETGISAARINALFNLCGGLPSLQEFLALCQYFGQDAAKVIEQINSPDIPLQKVSFTQQNTTTTHDMQQVAGLLQKAQKIVQRNINKTELEATDHVKSPNKKEANSNNVPTQSQIEDMIKNFQLVANTDPNKKIESETPDD